jgi:hypothetical protein
LELWLPFRGILTDSCQPQLQDRRGLAGVYADHVLLRHDALEKIRAGRVTVVFRRWQRPRVRAGTRLRTMIGVVEVRSVAAVADVTDADAQPAGYENAETLRADIPGDAANPLFRMEVSYAGPDPRIALRQGNPSPAELAEIMAALDRMDRTGPRGPWTRTVLGLIADRPATRAGDLFADAGYPDLQTFKRDVRRLKELGLTESLEVGYRLSPRGAAVLNPPG